MYMFSEKTGEKVAEKVYNDLMAHEDVELWYDNYAVARYDMGACWDRAVSEAMDRLHLDHCEVTGLMAWIIATSPDDADTAFDDGFGHLLGNALQSVYELREDQVDDDTYGVLVSVAVTGRDGEIVDDLGYLFDVDGMSYEDACRYYDSVGITTSQERTMWLYLRKWVGKEEGLALMYEVISGDGTSSVLAISQLGHNLED